VEFVLCYDDVMEGEVLRTEIYREERI